MGKYKLTAFLIKEEFDEFDAIIRNDLIDNVFELKEEFNLDGFIYTGRNQANPPDWVDFLQQGTDEAISELTNSSTRAVVLIRWHGRIFAFPFGFGRYMLRDDVVVRDFGIKVVLNSVNPVKLRSVDTTTFDELTIHARTQTSRTTAISTFGIQIDRDLLQAVTGQPNNENYGNVMTGRDSVQFTYELDFRQFGEVCDYLYEKYISNEYRANFEWFDNLQMVSDPTLVLSLNNRLLDAINARDENRFYLAPPEVIDWMNIGGFSFTRGGSHSNDLEVTDYFHYINGRNIDLESLKRHQIYVWNNDFTDNISKWRLYNCIVFETEHENELYILTVGIWFRIEREFSNVVNQFIANITISDLDLPMCRVDEPEGVYNDRVGEERNDIITLDRKNVYIDGSPIEVCDLLTRRCQFIHVKPWKSSSTLSHLFSQGRVSALSLLQDIQFRRRTREKIASINSDFVDIVSELGINPAEVEIVFAIIDTDTRPIQERLPFFSKLNMMHTVRLLENLRFRVSQVKIIREDA